MAKMQSLSDKEIKAKKAEKKVEEFKEKLKSASAGELASKGLAIPCSGEILPIHITIFAGKENEKHPEFTNSGKAESGDQTQDIFTVSVEQGGYEEVNGKDRE